MTGLYYHKVVGDYTTLSLLRFYENGYVIYTKETGEKGYFGKLLKRFSMDGHVVNGDSGTIFCGAYEIFNNRIVFKVENEILDTSDSWVVKDVISFRGELSSEEMLLKQSSKRNPSETEMLFAKTEDAKLLEELG